MTVSLCKHRFVVLPPQGSIFHPSDCTECGLTYAAFEAGLQQQEKDLIEGTARDGQCPACGNTGRLYGWQEPEQPWHAPGDHRPTKWLCATDYDAAVDDYNAALSLTVHGGLPTP
ncbi:hypothetical protein ACFC1B_26645 [Streptomyces xiamenensis]|uniref:hypothetical protein n=1 Tax=Streptomyces xiamenensis TaxID=408015 RepID=UPI0035E18B96